MSDLYAAIAEQYKKSKFHPWRLHIERFTFFELLGDLADKTVLDLACGEGFYTRQFKQHGAARVVGVDISPQMIELARAEEARKPLGIEYLVQDAGQLDLPERFDLVVAAYLLNYARDRDQLLTMTRAISRSLKPGCRFVTVNDNTAQPRDAYSRTRKYGLTKTLVGEPREGATIAVTIFNEHGGSFSFDNYYLSRATVEGALHAAGLGSIRWHALRVSPQGEAEFGKDYWSDFLTAAPVIFLECTKE
jgi:SAM-dependent methyltransferase